MIKSSRWRYFMHEIKDPAQAASDLSTSNASPVSADPTLDLGPQEALAYRKRLRGMIGVTSKIAVKDSFVLSLVYTPGVAAPCLEIAKDPYNSFDYTIRGNTIALLTDGSSAFGFGYIGPMAGLPLFEDSCILLRKFVGVDFFSFSLDL